MPTTPETIVAGINEAAAAGFRGRLIARGQARAMIWRDGALPPDAPAFSPQLSYDLHSYGYAMLGLGLRLRELGVTLRRPVSLSSKPQLLWRQLWPEETLGKLIETSTSS